MESHAPPKRTATKSQCELIWKCDQDPQTGRVMTQGMCGDFNENVPQRLRHLSTQSLVSDTVSAGYGGVHLSWKSYVTESPAFRVYYLPSLGSVPVVHV